MIFRSFTDANILCVVLRFRSRSVIADVDMTVPANNSADAQYIETNALNITSMDIGNITVNNETYIAFALNSNVTVENRTTESTTMATTTLGTTPSSTTEICFEFTITFKGIFLPALGDELSEAFWNFAEAIIELFRWLFKDFTRAEITCETVVFRNANGNVVAKVRIIVLANNSAHAEDIENYALSITSMDIGNITANNETYIACAVNTTAICDNITTESTPMATTTLGTTSSSTVDAATTMTMTDASTTTSAPPSLEVVVVFAITFQATFSNELEDPSSRTFIDLATAICLRLRMIFRSFTKANILCVVVRFRSGSVIADVNMTAPANNSADAQYIETKALNITSMDIANITANNQTYMASALNSSATVENRTTESTTMATTTLGTTPSSTTDAPITMTTLTEENTTMTTMMTDASTTLTTMMTGVSGTMTTKTDPNITMTTMTGASTTMTTMSDASATMTTMSDASATMTTMMTDPSTTTSAPPSLEVIVIFALTFQAPFSNDLEDPLSAAFTNLANAICERLRVIFRSFTNANILCVVVRFRSGSVLADVNITVPANNSADAQDIESNALNITSMDIGNITANNETYITSAVTSTVTGVDTTPESTTMATTTLGTMPSSSVAPMNQSTEMSTQPGVPETTTAATLVTRRVRISLRVTQRGGQPLVYTDDLADDSSASFRELAELFCGAVEEYLRSSHNTLRSYACIVISFNPGSVVGDMRIDVGANTADQANEIAQTTTGIPDSNRALSLGNDSISVVPPPALITRRVRISLRVTQRGGEPLVYTDDLADDSSASFRELAELFCGAVKQYLMNLHDTLRSYECIVISFTPGSVVGDMRIDVAANTADQANEIAQTTMGIPDSNRALSLGNDSISVVPPPAPEGLSTGAIVAIVLGVIVGLLLLIVCSCCILVQMASRNNAAKLALGEAYHGPYGRESPMFFSNDPFDDSDSYNSLDLREYAVGQAVERIAQDRALRNPTRVTGQEHFRTPYVVADDEVRSVERNPIYY